MSSVTRTLSQIGGRERFLVVVLSSYAYYPESIPIGLADAIAEGYAPVQMGSTITAKSLDDLLETYLITYAEENLFEQLSVGTVLKDLGKTITWIAGNGLKLVQWQLVQRVRNVLGEGPTLFPNDIFYVPTFYADSDALDDIVGVARIG